MSVNNINAEELRELIKNDRDNLEIIDVREPEEYALLRIKGSKLIPAGEVSTNLNKIDWGKEVIFICRSGARSSVATGVVSVMGKDVNNLQEGILGFYKVGSEFFEGDDVKN